MIKENYDKYDLILNLYYKSILYLKKVFFFKRKETNIITEPKHKSTYKIHRLIRYFNSKFKVFFFPFIPLPLSVGEIEFKDNGQRSPVSHSWLVTNLT